VSIELAIAPRLQESNMSCWWTAIAVVLEYYGRRYRYPWNFRHEFERPWNSPFVWQSFEPPSLDEAMRADPTLRRLPTHEYGTRLSPHEWYTNGMPNSAWGMRRVCEITGFEGVRDCPAYGSWQAADYERIIRAHGPIVFHGFWNGFGHTIVVCGIDTGAQPLVAYMDPALGFVTSQPIAAFNQRMSGMTIGMDAMGFNPIYLPQGQQVLAVVGA
jgi:hypothetical protein